MRPTPELISKQNAKNALHPSTLELIRARDSVLAFDREQGPESSNMDVIERFSMSSVVYTPLHAYSSHESTTTSYILSLMLIQCMNLWQTTVRSMLVPMLTCWIVWTHSPKPTKTSALQFLLRRPLDW